MVGGGEGGMDGGVKDSKFEDPKASRVLLIRKDEV